MLTVVVSVAAGAQGPTMLSIVSQMRLMDKDFPFVSSQSRKAAVELR